MSVISNVAAALRTSNLPEGVEPDPISKWVVITRASVFPMTFFAAAIGGLLAVSSGGAQFFPWLLAALGLLLAHASNNMMNDYFDLESGVDTPDYARALYAPHPILSGWVSKRELLQAILLVNAIDVAIALYLTWLRGWPVPVFAFAGLFLSVFYVAPPLRFKHHGLGEPSVFLIWGPLMIAGSYFVTAGALPGWVWAASVPYGILVTSVLFGKHIDKCAVDEAKGIHTLPVLLGAERARRVNQALMVGFFVFTAALVLAGVLSVWSLLVLGAVPRLLRVLKLYGEPPPEEPPKNYPVWPLWYVSAAFVVTRQAGALFALGLLLHVLWPLSL
ncbi:MAG: prenyltransferase [Myxococcota bacterium]|nr:prenyltransferase [Myxococcota bacterium]